MRSKKIPGLQKYRDRPRNGLFEALPVELRHQAQMRLHKLCEPWGNDLPRWRYAILVGQAKRLTLNPPDSAWGRSMRAKKGGKAVQKLYRFEGRNPTAAAASARKIKRFHPKATTPLSFPVEIMPRDSPQRVIAKFLPTV